MKRSCDEYEAMVPEYIDGELSDELRAELEEHLSACASCTEHLAQTRELFREIASAGEEPPAELAAGVMSRIATENAFRKSSKRRLIRRIGTLAASFVILAGIIAAIPVIMGTDSEKSEKSGSPDQYSRVMKSSAPSGSAEAEESSPETYAASIQTAPTAGGTPSDGGYTVDDDIQYQYNDSAELQQSSGLGTAEENTETPSCVFMSMGAAELARMLNEQ